MKIIYACFIIIITTFISSLIYWFGESVDKDTYWFNTIILLSIIGFSAYYRYEDYEKNKKMDNEDD